MQISLRLRSKGTKLSYNAAIRLVAFYFVATQILTVLRATSIYNTSYISNYMRLFVSLVFILLFFCNEMRVSRGITPVEAVFIVIPIIGLVIGFLNNQIGRDYFSDFFNALAFALIVAHYRMNPYTVSREDLEYLAKWEFVGFLISLVTYKVFPLFGYPIKSVGIASNFLLFPLAFSLAYKKKWWILVLIAILLGGKRGVMISAIALMCYFFVFDKRRSIRPIFAVIFASIILSTGLYLTESPEHLQLLPENLQRVGARFMKVNPFSDYVDFHSDGRLDEIEGALNSFEINPTNLMVGKGNGFVYDVYHNGVLTTKRNHNVHFTPISFLTRYGVVYTVVFYINYLWILFKSTKKIRGNRNHQFIMCVTLFLVGTFVDQFTVFLPYTDYQFMICFGLMNGILMSDCKNEKKCAN